MDKRDRAELFRARLMEAMGHRGLNRSALARNVGSDRSTIGQLLNPELPRLPNGQLMAELARELNVTSDWLLGLTHRPERPRDILDAAMALSPAARTSTDEQLLGWLKAAAGYKIRHVPATLPEMLKTEAMVNWEYRISQKPSPDPAISALKNQLEEMQNGQSDYEIAVPVHELTACAEGTGYYQTMPDETRREQLAFMADVTEALYPRLRLFAFDAHLVYSAPITIFGPQLAIVYIGNCYLAFRTTDRIRALTSHFDILVREASIGARKAPDFIRGLTIN